LENKGRYSGFVFEVNFNGYIKYLFIAGTGENYKLRNKLYDLFVKINGALPDQIFSFNQ